MRLRLSVSALLALAPAALVAQQPTPPPPGAQPPAVARATVSGTIPLDRVVAVVGNVVITQSNLRERLVAKTQSGMPVPTDSTAVRVAAIATLNELVDEELLLEKAKELKIEVPDADVNSTVDKQFKAVRSRFGTEAEFKTELTKAGYGTPDEYRRFIADGIRRNELLTRTTRKLREDGKLVPANITDADVQESFEKSRSDLPKREASVTWRQIIIAPRPSAPSKDRARARAESLLAEIKRGAEFEALAKRESADSGSRVNGGDLGWTRRGKMVPEFDRYLFGYYALAPGQLSPVVETAFGYHIIRVDRVNAGEVKSRHILITPTIDSADVARARVEGDSVAKLWRAGVSFDTLAKKHHDFRSGEETTLLTPFPRARLPQQYQQAFADRKPQDIVVFDVPGNANIPIKVVVAQINSVEAGGDMTLAEVKEQIRSSLAEAGGMRRYLDTLRKQSYVSVRPEVIDVSPLPAVPAR
ncbi:MAG TPA: peptidylprolyl isomerase [Gemmatimonadaceae bacterium]|nr:peptidylprolyl isomerase [Gemmatimonadaceae bacterium]